MLCGMSATKKAADSPMDAAFSNEQKLEIISSIRRYFAGNLDCELSEMQAGFLLDYFMEEIAPFAYNKGIDDAQKYLIRITEDLPGICFQEALTHWKNGKPTGIRRRPGM